MDLVRVHDPRPGQLLLDVRSGSGLTQAEVARRADVPQSMVSAYESGRRQPSVPVLSRLLEAMGHELTLLARPIPVGLAILTGPVGRRVRRHRDRLIELAARGGVRQVRVFGRVARGEERPDEQVDLLVEALAVPLRLLLVSAELEVVLGVPVHLVPEQQLSPDQLSRIRPDLIALDSPIELDP